MASQGRTKKWLRGDMNLAEQLHSRTSETYWPYWLPLEQSSSLSKRQFFSGGGFEKSQRERNAVPRLVLGHPRQRFQDPVLRCNHRHQSALAGRRKNVKLVCPGNFR